MRSPGMKHPARLPILFCTIVLLVLLVSPVSTTAESSDIPNDNPHLAYFPSIHGPAPAKVVIAAAHIDSAVSYEPDEAVMLWNIGHSEARLAGWQIAANTRHVTIPQTATLTLLPGQHLWCAAQADAFRHSFGFSPACEWDEDTDPDVLDLDGNLTIANGGGSLRLLDAGGRPVDTLLYGDESRPIDGWETVAAQLYARGAIRESGQIWQRKLDPQTWQPIDTDRASDWSGDLADLDWGRRVRMPGWRGMMSADGMIPLQASAEATTAVAVGPEGLYLPIAQALASASATIDLSLYTFEHPQMAQVLVDAASRGIRVRLLLEGGPAGGISDVQKWCVSRLVDSGAEVRYMAPTPDAPNGYRTRYNFLHAKYAVIDGKRAFNGTENFTLDAMPVHTGEAVGGRRGFYLFTDAAPIVAELATLFAHDWDANHFLDLFHYDAEHSKYGAPPSDFTMPEPSIYEEIESSPFGNAVSTRAWSSFRLVSAPENALFPNAGLMEILQRAGSGDEIVAWQLYEHAHWGDPASNAVADPNPRLQAIVDAARHGARVRLLLDAYFDSGDGLRSNQVTQDYLHGLAATEGLDIQVRLGNPTGGGIHAKVVLVRLGDERWSAVGSLNGGEISHKLNREVVVLTDAPPIHDRLSEVFEWDWALSE